MVEIISVRFKEGGKHYYFNPNGEQFQPGEGVIVETTRGTEFGQCVQGNTPIDEMELTAPLRPVLRRATQEDLLTREKNKEREAKAFQICQEKILEHGLEMKLVDAEWSFEGNKVLFFFTAEGRVDFRALVKDLASAIHARIELRQIGVRDEAKMLGGLGICGRPFCCAQFLDEFQPVSIKMAKTQNLSLNPTKISGTCGRLMCCLKYEQEAYEDLLRTSPKPESFVDTPEGRGTVAEVDLLRQRVKVRMEDNPETVSVFANTDIAVLRSGKAKKNDPPIPADLAPISGGGKRPVQQEPQEQLRLEPIRFRYSTETLGEEPQEPSEAAAPAKTGRSRTRRRKETAGEEAKAQPRQEKPRKEPKPAKPEQPKAAKPSRPESEPPKKHRRRPRQHKAKTEKTEG